MGLVQHVIYGQDEKSTVAEVKVGRKTCQRVLQRLVPLEIRSGTNVEGQSNVGVSAGATGESKMEVRTRTQKHTFTEEIWSGLSCVP